MRTLKKVGWSGVWLFVAFTAARACIGFIQGDDYSGGPMGGGCAAFQSGGSGAEYLAGCTDEILNMPSEYCTAADGSRLGTAACNADGRRYPVAQGILFETWQATADCIGPNDYAWNWDFARRERRPVTAVLHCRKAPNARQISLALTAQYGGACQPFELQSVEDILADAAAGIALETRTRACLEELKRLRPKAWQAVLERHWRLTDRAAWGNDALLPSGEQLQRAFTAERQILGYDRADLYRWGRAALVIVGALLALAALMSAGRRLYVRRAEWQFWNRRKQQSEQRREQRTEEPKREQQKTQSQPPPAWDFVDATFRRLFENSFGPNGNYPAKDVRDRVYREFPVFVSRIRKERNLRGVYPEFRLLLIEFVHPDKAPHRPFTMPELDELSKFVSQVFTQKTKAA